jgi:Flp pilus assembly protein TadG
MILRRLMGRLRGGFLADDGGGATFEGALIAVPFMGILDFGVAFTVSSSLERATERGGYSLAAELGRGVTQSAAEATALATARREMIGFGNSCLSAPIVDYWDSRAMLGVRDAAHPTPGRTFTSTSAYARIEISCDWQLFSPLSYTLLSGGLLHLHAAQLVTLK